MEIEAREHVLAAKNVFLKLPAPKGYGLSGSDADYHLIELDQNLVLIGEGGFAKVYKQKSTGLIVKKLNQDEITNKSSRHRFKWEYEIMKGLLEADGVLDVYDFDQNSCSYTMEEGEQTLAAFLNNPLSDEIKTAIIKQILETFSLLHNKGIIHRNISPSNIFILQGRVKIADFGLGKDLETIASYHTMGTQNLGQLQYCAPEQLTL